MTKTYWILIFLVVLGLPRLSLANDPNCGAISTNDGVLEPSEAEARGNGSNATPATTPGPVGGPSGANGGTGN